MAIQISKFKTLTIAFLFLNINNAFNQTNTLPGYVITTNGDSISGNIVYNGHEFRNEKIEFYPKGSGSITTYGTKDLKLYRFYDFKCYVPLAISINNEVKEVFVEYLINGIVKLYYYSHLDIYYAQNEAGEILAMSNFKKEYYVNGQKYSKDSKDYVGVLKYIFKDDLKTLQILENENIVLSEKTLVKMGQDYHNALCDDWSCVIYSKDIVTVKNTEKAEFLKKVSLGLISSYNYQFYFDSESFINEEQRTIETKVAVKTKSNNSFGLGAFVDINIRRISPNLFVRNEISYNKNDLTKNYQFISSQPEMKNRTYNFNLHHQKKYFNNSFMLKYNLINSGNSGMFIQGGYAFSYLIYNTYQRTGHYKYEFYNSIREQSLYTKIMNINEQKYLHKPTVGLGYFRKINSMYITADLRYQLYLNKTLANNKYISSYNYQIIDIHNHEINLNIGVGFYLNNK